jgi:uncharacterized damage-inducible protein DinB
MDEIGSIHDWFAYNDRARRGYLELFAQLSPEELARDRGASYPSLLDIFLHALDAMSSWVERASVARGPRYPSLERPDHPSLTELIAYEVGVRAEVARFFDGLTPQDLDRTFPVPKAPGFPEAFDLSVRDMLWHLVEEELQHRGELNALLWQMDLDAPVFDWIDWKKSARARGPVP